MEGFTVIWNTRSYNEHISIVSIYCTTEFTAIRYLLSIVFWIIFPYNFSIASSVSNKLAYL